jgi:hypothetical protein
MLYLQSIDDTRIVGPKVYETGTSAYIISGQQCFNNKYLRGFSPRANYADHAKLVPTFVDRGCHVVSTTDPLRPYSRIF